MIKYNDMMNKDVIWILIRVKWGVKFWVEGGIDMKEVGKEE